MNKIKLFSSWLKRKSTGWVTLIALIIFLLFMAIVLPGQSSRAEAVSGEAGSPDLSFYYPADKLYSMAEAYGPDGRLEFVRVRFTFDLFFPLIYTFFLVTSISWLFSRTFGNESPWQLANLAPMIGMLLDFLENTCTSIVMLRYPDATQVIASLASFFTMGKWIFVVASFLFVIIGLFGTTWKWFKTR